MYKLLAVMVVVLICAMFSSSFSKFNFEKDSYDTKEKFFFLLLLFCMVVFVGLRTKYNDTTTYIGIYKAIIPTREGFEKIDWAIGSNPGFNLVNFLLKRLNVSVQGFLLIYATFTLSSYLWFIRKYTNNILFSTFLFLTVGGFVFTLAAVKQCTAVAICLLATDKAINKKYLTFVILVLIAVTFHPYSFLYLAVPFLDFYPTTKKTYFMVILFAALGFLLNSLLGNLVDVTSMIGEGYDVESFTGEGVNPFRVAVVLVPLLLSFITKNSNIERYDKNSRGNNITINLATLNGEIMFIGLFGTANYFARLANYFVIFQTLAIPKLINRFDEKWRKILYLFASGGYFMFFVYENAINEHFDMHYESISIIEYLRSIIGG